MKLWFVYILSNDAHTLYVGFTDDVGRRFDEHRTHADPNAFTARYTFDRVVYYEALASPEAAMAREKHFSVGVDPESGDTDEEPVVRGGHEAPLPAHGERVEDHGQKAHEHRTQSLARVY